jgi:hypothetical protein
VVCCPWSGSGVAVFWSTCRRSGGLFSSACAAHFLLFKTPRRARPRTIATGRGIGWRGFRGGLASCCDCLWAWRGRITMPGVASHGFIGARRFGESVRGGNSFEREPAILLDSVRSESGGNRVDDVGVVWRCRYESRSIQPMPGKTWRHSIR